MHKFHYVVYEQTKYEFDIEAETDEQGEPIVDPDNLSDYLVADNVSSSEVEYIDRYNNDKK